VAETDGEHGLADAGRPDEQHLGGVLEEAEGGELVDELAVNRWLGVEVEVGEPPWRGQRREAGEASMTSGFGGGELDVEEPFQERGVAELGRRGVVSSPGSASAAALSRR
jgi:hypothetical protein